MTPYNDNVLMTLYAQNYSSALYQIWNKKKSKFVKFQLIFLDSTNSDLQTVFMQCLRMSTVLPVNRNMEVKLQSALFKL